MASPTTASIRRLKDDGALTDRGRFTNKVLTDGVGALPPEAENDESSVWRKRYDSPEEKVKAFLDELGDQVAALDSDENWRHYLDTMSKFHVYSMRNQMLIALQRPGATRVAGFKKWQELGRQVRKGERGISILAPRKARVELKDAAGRPILDEHGKPRREQRIIGSTTATVFDVSQTDGPDLPDSRQSLSEEPPAGLMEDLEQSVADLGFELSTEKITKPGLMGFTTADGSKRIVIKEGLTPGSRARVLAHELGHVAAGHLDRMDEYHSGHGGVRGQMEVEADSISYALLRANGMSPEVGRANAAYISGWSGRSPESVKTAAETVSKAVKSLFEKSKWSNAAQ